MSEELRVIAKHILRIVDIPNIVDNEGRWYEVSPLAKKLAESYIAEHPADDDEPVTSDWLGRVMHKSYEDDLPDVYWWINPTIRVRFDVQIRPSIDAGVWECVLAREDGHIEMPDIKTRRDVRRLLAALGIEVKS